MNVPTPSIAELEAEQRDLVLPRFGPLDAWRLGTLMTERAIADSSPVAIDVRRPGLVLFRAALPGSTPDQEEWIRLKSATALRLEASTLLIRERFASIAGQLREAGLDSRQGWLPADRFAVAGGAVPIAVAETGVVAVATVSGLTDELDHHLVVESMRTLQAEMGAS